MNLILKKKYSYNYGVATCITNLETQKYYVLHKLQ